MLKQIIARPFKLGNLLRSSFGRGLFYERIRGAYHELLNSDSGIQTVDANKVLADVEFEIQLKKFPWHGGNASMYEQLLICSLVRQHLSPGQNFLEIGTFNGATAYNVANNLPENSRCLTIDLPPDTELTSSVQTEGDLEIIRSQARRDKVHFGLSNVEQFFEDSTQYDFSKIEFSAAFIDGGHHFDIVSCDTANVIKHISRPGLIMWHDFYGSNEITTLLRSLGHELQIKHLHTTHLAYAIVE